MKIAYLISTYQDSEQLKRTINALNYNNLTDFYIHVDKKVDIRSFKESICLDNVYFVENRILVCWGGYSQVLSILEMIKLMINSGKKYDRVVSMTGLDYPIYSNKKIQQVFDNDKQYMIGYNITKGKNKKQRRKILRYWFFDHKFVNPKIVKFLSRFMNLLFLILPIRKKSKIKMINGEKIDIYFSSDYWALTYDCVLNCYNKFKNDKKIQKYFKYSFAPSELFMATMVFNSKYGKNAEIKDDNLYSNLYSLTKLHYIDYNKKIKILSIKDYNEIKKSDKMFARKVMTNISEELINRIDENRKID